MKKKRMQIKFEGQSNQIDANTLISVLLHYQTVITEANRELSGGLKTIELKVNAIEKGSFIIDVSLVEGIKQIFSSDTVGYLANLCGVVTGIFTAYKLLKGKPAKTEEEKTAITIKKSHGNEVNVSYGQTIINVYNQPLVREAISKSIETADADVNVEGLIVDSGSDELVKFSKKEFKDYVYTDFDEDLRELRAFIDTLDNVQRVEVLPYHDLAKPKYAKLSIPYPLADVLPPTKDRVENAKRILKAF